MRIIIATISILLGFPVISQISDTVQVGYTKSAYLIFDSENVKADIGNAEEVSLRITGNKVILQALVEQFEETNLLVEVDERIYMFIVRYNDFATKFIYNYAAMKVIGSTGTNEPKKTDGEFGEYFVKNTEDQDSIKKLYGEVCDSLLASEDTYANRGIVEYKLSIYLKDIAIFDDKMFFEFEVKNKSNIPYIIDFYRYRVRTTKRRLKGESFQEVLLEPVIEYKRPARIEGKSTYRYVIVMDKFVLTENKKLVVEHWEDNGDDLNVEGGRKIDFDIFHQDIINVRNYEN